MPRAELPCKRLHLADLAMDRLMNDARRLANERGRQLDRQRRDLALEAGGLGEFEWDMARDRMDISEDMRSLTGVKALCGSMPVSATDEVEFELILNGPSAAAFAGPWDALGKVLLATTTAPTVDALAPRQT